MSKAIPASASYAVSNQAGRVTPVVVGPDKGTKEVVIIGSVVLALAVGMGIFWIASQGDDVKTTGTSPMPVMSPAISVVSTPIEPAKPIILATALPTQLKDTLHADVYFDFGRNRLSDEAKTYLGAHAAFLMRETDWGVIIQGYTDQKGGSAYNKRLGQKRAEAVRDLLASLGIPDTSMKVVSLGKDGTLCQDDSSDCQQLNRRVHLEFIKIGAAHMATPVPVDVAIPLTAPAINSASDDQTLHPAATLQDEATPTEPVVTPVSPAESATKTDSEGNQ